MAELVVPKIDFTPLGQLGTVYRDAQKRQTLASLGQGLADGTVDYRSAAGQIAQTGDIDTSVKFLQLAEARKKQEDEITAGNQWMTGFQGAYGGGGAQATPPAGGPSTVSSPPASAPLPANGRAPVQSSPRVWGDQEAEAAGLYEPTSPTRQQPTMSLASLGAAPTAASPLPPSTSPGSRSPAQMQAAQVQPAPAQQSPSMPTTGGLSPRAMFLIQGSSNLRLPQATREMAKTLLGHELESTKATSDMREWAFAKAQDPNTPDFTSWVRGNKAAGRTQINVGDKLETEEAKAAGKGAGERRATMFASAGAAHKSLSNLSRVEGLLNQVSQGKLEPGRMTISAWAKSMGLNDDVAKSIGLDPAGVGSAQALNALSSEMLISKIGAGGFPANNFSDADRGFLQGTLQQLGNDPRANRIIVETSKRVAQLDIARAKSYAEWKKDSGNKGKGFEDFELEFSEQVAQRDVFGDLRKEAETIVGAPRNDIGNTYQNPGAAPGQPAQRGQQPQQPAQNAAPVRINSPEDARRLPPGTRFLTPDGREMVR